MHIKARRSRDEEKELKGAAQWVSFHSGGNLSKSTEPDCVESIYLSLEQFKSLRVARNLRPQS